MKSYYNTKSNNSKIVLYAVIAALVAGIGFVALQDITVPTEHNSQEIEANLKK